MGSFYELLLWAPFMGFPSTSSRLLFEEYFFILLILSPNIKPSTVLDNTHNVSNPNFGFLLLRFRSKKKHFDSFVT